MLSTKGAIRRAKQNSATALLIEHRGVKWHGGNQVSNDLIQAAAV